MNGGFFIIGILFLFFAVWVATGGPHRPISFAGPFITPITNVNQQQHGYGSITALRQGASNIGSSYFSRLSTGINAIPVSFGTPSDERGAVTISHNSTGPAGNLASTEYVTLQTSGRIGDGVSITGWELLSAATGNWGYIPGGSKIAYVGVVNQTSPIVLTSGQRAYVNSGRSPIGTSFLENECLGYISQYQDFYPPLTRNSCPAAVDDFDRFYPNALSDDDCYTYIKTFSRCEIPHTKDFPHKLTTSCKAFITNTFNYNGCVAVHQNDPNFFGNTWRVYLGSAGQLWKSTRDSIKLLDTTGKTVDLYTY